MGVIEIFGQHGRDEIFAAQERSETICFGTTGGGTFEAKITAITHMPGRIGNVGIKAKNGEKEYQGWYNYNTHRGILAP